jgi:hypothetical protein
VTAATEARERTYGGWRRPASPGVGPLKLIPTMLMMGGLAATLLVSMIGGLWWALGFAFIGLLAGGPGVIPYRGRTLYAEWARGWRWRRHQRLGRHLYRSGLAGVTPTGTRTLPGLLGRVKEWAAVDALGRDFALLEIQAARQWAIVMRVAAQGGALVDADTTDVWVASWGEYLAQLGQEGGVVQAAAVIETVPEAGAQLSAHVESSGRDDAPDFARAVAAAAAAELPADVADTIGYVSLTFSERGLGIERRGNESTGAAVAEEIGRRLPGLSVSLKDAGASEGWPLTVEALSRRVREAYDPEIAIDLARQEAEGLAVHTEWDDAGPSAHEETSTSYRHDSGLSRTYEALKVPPGLVRDNWLERLTSPSHAAPRKRVTLLYRPTDAAHTAETVDRDLKSAINRTGRRKGLVHAHDSADLKAAVKATEEEAEGAGVVSFSMLVTVTVLDVDAASSDAIGERSDVAAKFDRACTTVERAARGARFRLSPVRGAQAAGFAAALGIGLSLPDLSVVPHVAREHF